MKKSENRITRLSNKELDAILVELVSRERRLTLEVIDHLIELDKRKLHAALAYSSLFTYCTGRLGYSNAAAARRVSAAKAIRRFPGIRGMISRRELSLSSLSLVSRELHAPHARKLIDAIRGKTRREAEIVLARFKGPVAQRERIKPIAILRTRSPSFKKENGGAGPEAPPSRIAGDEQPGETAPGAAAPGAAAPATATHSTTTGQSTADTSMPSGGPLADPVRRGLESSQNIELMSVTDTEVQTVFRFEFAGDAGFFKKYERAATILSSRNRPPTSIEEVMNLVFDAFLEQRDPARRQARRDRRKVLAKARASGRGSERTGGRADERGSEISTD